jgi:hypothetical protein
MVLAAMSAAVSEEAPARTGTLRRGWRTWRWRTWGSSVLFALVAICFLMPFASTSCTLPGGYGRGEAGSSTVYRGVDLAVGAVPAVTPDDKQARPDATVNAGQLGFQPEATLVLLAVLVGLGLALTGAGARLLAVWAVGAGALLVLAELVAVNAISDRIAASDAPLPAGKVPTDYVNTGQGFGLALSLLVLLAAVNGVAALREARRARALAP